MFTGIITGVGRIVAIHPLGSSLAHGKRLTIETPLGYLDDVALGDSIALNGACMTATQIELSTQRFSVDVSAESLARTSGLGQTGPINLEKALRAHDRLGGHIVSAFVIVPVRAQSPCAADGLHTFLGHERPEIGRQILQHARIGVLVDGEGATGVQSHEMGHALLKAAGGNLAIEGCGEVGEALTGGAHSQTAEMLTQHGPRCFSPRLACRNP
jgi:riboflavin synthase alpha subunit